MIGRSEEKLRPKSIFWRRVIAKYVVWVEIAGYVLVISLFGGLIYAMTIKAEDEFLEIPGDVTLAVDVLRAHQNVEVASVLPKDASLGGKTKAPAALEESAKTPVTLEESPTLVAKASLLKNLGKELGFARAQKLEAVAQNIETMIAQAKETNNAVSARKAIVPEIAGSWYPTVGQGDVVTSGAVLGMVIDPGKTKIKIDTKAPNVSQKGKGLKEDQPATITVTTAAGSFYMLGKMTEGGKKNPQIQITSIPPDQMDKIVDFFKANPEQPAAFPAGGANNIKVLIGEKSWASLIWK